jgi:type I restriction enzyme S subunit
MIAELKPYPAMKDSGVPWLGKVPAHWDVKRGKALFRCIDIRSSTGEEELLTVSSARGVIPRSSTTVTMFKAESYVGYKLCWPGDLVINSLWAWARGLGVSRHHGIVSSAYGVYRLRPPYTEYSSYIHELVRSTPFNWELQVRSKGIWISRLQLTDEAFLGAPFPLPPSEEQAATVRFLRHVDRRIRHYIRAKQKLIKLLEEQKQALIHRAVARGLDPNVRLKPSGVEWLGDVPEHWSVAQLRQLISLITSGSRGWAEFYTDTGAIFLQSGNLGRSMSLNLSFIQYVQPPRGAEGERTNVRRGDVLLCITGALTGNVVLVDVDLPAPAFVNQHVALIRPTEGKVYPRYLAFALYSEIGRIQLKTSEYGGTKQGLGLDDVKAALLPLPPALEQVEICSVLDQRLANRSNAIVAAQREIILLREYRTRLIADVVTGKLDVREAAAKLPDEADAPGAFDEIEALSDSDEAGADDAEVIPEDADG